MKSETKSANSSRSSKSSLYYTPNSSRSSPINTLSGKKRNANKFINSTAAPKRKTSSVKSTRQKRAFTSANSREEKRLRTANTNTVQKKAQVTNVNALAKNMSSMTIGKKHTLTNNNEKTLMQDIERTRCANHLTNRTKLKNIFSVLNRVKYVQGYHFIALQLLRRKSEHSAYNIFGSEGMKRFLMLKPEVRPKLMRSLSPLFPVFPPLKPLQKEFEFDILLMQISVNFAQEFYINNESCEHKLLDFLLSPAKTLNYENDVSFFQDRDLFTLFYLFILRHLSIVITETIKQKKLTNTEMHNPMSFISKNDIEAKTIDSVKGHIKTDLKHYKSHCLAAFTVMLLDIPFGNIGSNSIKDHLRGAQQLIHVTNLPGPNSNSQSLNLQGIKPFWGHPEITFSTVQEPLFIKLLPPIVGKLLMAYMTIYEHVSLEGVKRMLEYFKSVVYVDNDGKVMSLVDALKDKTKKTKKIKKSLKSLPLLAQDPTGFLLVQQLLQLF
jgi:hypothetical protein